MKHLYIFITIICFAFAIQLHAQTLYVCDTKGNDDNVGTSWNKAFKTLSKALQKANSTSAISKILVTNGTYYPSGTSALTALNKDSSFVITKGGLQIIGGFDPKTHEKNSQDSTILLGNSCYHVLVIAGLISNADSVIIDGFTISGGFANGLQSKTYANEAILAKQGAGIYLSNNLIGGKLTIKNCKIAYNYASEGGGIYNSISSPLIINCNFIGNKVNDLGGAAIFNNAGSPQIISCNFLRNGEGMYGGAIYNITDASVKAVPIIANCIFTDNMVDQWGAGIYAQGGSINISNCIFSGNESFCANESAAGGGGIYFSNASAVITNSTFCGNNVANAAGAGIFSEKSKLTIGNCTFSGNNAKYGGAICSRGNQSDVKIYNSILYGNSSAIDKYGNGSIAVNYSVIDGGYIGMGNYNGDPLFINAPAFAEAPFCDYKNGRAKYFPFDYHLKAGSQAIDTGSNNFYITAGGRLTDYDLAGKKRFVGNAIDIGAYEYEPTSNGPATNLVLPKSNVGEGGFKASSK